MVLAWPRSRDPRTQKPIEILGLPQLFPNFRVYKLLKNDSEKMTIQ